MRRNIVPENSTPQEGLYKDTKEEKINTIAKVVAIDFTVKNEK